LLWCPSNWTLCVVYRDFPGSGSVYPTPDSGGECGIPYEAYFQMPSQGPDKPWYSVEYGPIHFTMMSTEMEWTRGSEQVSDHHFQLKWSSFCSVHDSYVLRINIIEGIYYSCADSLSLVFQSCVEACIFERLVREGILAVNSPMSYFARFLRVSGGLMVSEVFLWCVVHVVGERPSDSESLANTLGYLFRVTLATLPFASPLI
jgi:hypothetical protein